MQRIRLAREPGRTSLATRERPGVLAEARSVREDMGIEQEKRFAALRIDS
jgi:hypothetical protein